MYNVRYHPKSNAYYIQIKSNKSEELKHKLKKANANLNRLRDTQSEEWRRAAHRRAVLQRQVRESLRYVRIREEDIPPNAHIRPLYTMEGEIVTISTPGYNKLIRNIHIDPPAEPAQTCDET